MSKPEAHTSTLERLGQQVSRARGSAGDDSASARLEGRADCGRGTAAVANANSDIASNAGTTKVFVKHRKYMVVLFKIYLRCHRGTRDSVGAGGAANPGT